MAWTRAAVASASTLRFLKHVAEQQSLNNWKAWSEISQSNPRIDATSIICMYALKLSTTTVDDEEEEEVKEEDDDDDDSRVRSSSAR